MHDEYLAITHDENGTLYVVASGNDLQAVRKAAEDSVSGRAHTATVAVYSRNAVVAIHCAPKWQ